MSSYDMFAPSAFALPIKPVEAPTDSKHKNISSLSLRKKAEEHLDRMIMEGKFIPSMDTLKRSMAQNSIEKEITRFWPTFLTRESEEEVVSLSEKVLIPIIPGYNFVGRLLGPRGSSVRRLSEATGCSIQVRGRGLLKNREREEILRKMPGWEHLKEELHVVIHCEDTERRGRQKMAHARHCVKELIYPMKNDVVKEKQLMELAILNGTYRPLPYQPVPLLTAPPPVNLLHSLVTLRFVE